MFVYEKKLQYPINIKTPNPKLAKMIFSQFGGADGDTERINGPSENMEFLFTYGAGGQLKSYDAGGTHYEVIEYVEGIGEVTLPDALKAEIEKGQQ